MKPSPIFVRDVFIEHLKSVYMELFDWFRGDVMKVSIIIRNPERDGSHFVMTNEEIGALSEFVKHHAEKANQ